MPAGLLPRLLREVGVADLLEGLTERLAASDLQSLMLEVYARVARRRTPRELLSQYERDRFVRPSTADVPALTELDRIAWLLLPDAYEPLELSPICPLGACSVVATVSQNKVISTSRNTEVVSDATNVLALECAVRRRRDPSAPALLAASQRLTRAQAFPGPRSWAHFRALCLVAAGRDAGSSAFEVQAMVTQLGFYLRYLDTLAGRGWRLERPRVSLTDVSGGRRSPSVAERVQAQLAAEHSSVELVLDPTRTAGRAYYQTVCFKLSVVIDGHETIEVGDGGDVPWTQQLLSNAKERLVISALGLERLAALRPEDRAWIAPA